MLRCALLGSSISVLVLAGCGGKPRLTTDQAIASFDAPKPGQTTREQLLLRLGEPSGRFEQDRILTYRLGYAPEDGSLKVHPPTHNLRHDHSQNWDGAFYSLVVVFDSGGVARESRIIKVR